LAWLSGWGVVVPSSVIDDTWFLRRRWFGRCHRIAESQRREAHC
jgi:hypothetical protein